jgi:hypothetical protein
MRNLGPLHLRDRGEHKQCSIVTKWKYLRTLFRISINIRRDRNRVVEDMKQHCTMEYSKG